MGGAHETYPSAHSSRGRVRRMHVMYVRFYAVCISDKNCIDMGSCPVVSCGVYMHVPLEFMAFLCGSRCGKACM